MKRFTLAVLPLTLLLSSCFGRAVGPDPRTEEEMWYETNFAGVFRATRWLRMSPGRDSVADQIHASFYTPSENGVGAGSVLFNGRPVGTRENTFTPGTRGIIYDETVDTAAFASWFGGRSAVFEVSGSAEAPAMRDSIVSPRSMLRITNLAPEQAVSRRNGFAIEWQASGEKDSRITVTVTSLAGALEGTADPSYVAFGESDDGRFVVGPDRLRSFPDGPLYIWLTRTTQRWARHNGRRYSLEAMSDVTMSVRLAE